MMTMSTYRAFCDYDNSMMSIFLKPGGLHAASPNEILARYRKQNFMDKDSVYLRRWAIASLGTMVQTASTSTVIITDKRSQQNGEPRFEVGDTLSMSILHALWREHETAVHYDWLRIIQIALNLTIIGTVQQQTIPRFVEMLLCITYVGWHSDKTGFDKLKASLIEMFKQATQARAQAGFKVWETEASRGVEWVRHYEIPDIPIMDTMQPDQRLALLIESVVARGGYNFWPQLAKFKFLNILSGEIQEVEVKDLPYPAREEEPEFPYSGKCGKPHGMLMEKFLDRNLPTKETEIYEMEDQYDIYFVSNSEPIQEVIDEFDYVKFQWITAEHPEDFVVRGKQTTIFVVIGTLCKDVAEWDFRYLPFWKAHTDRLN
jgi:hypothetical protein